MSPVKHASVQVVPLRQAREDPASYAFHTRM